MANPNTSPPLPRDWSIPKLVGPEDKRHNDFKLYSLAEKLKDFMRKRSVDLTIEEAVQELIMRRDRNR